MHVWLLFWTVFWLTTVFISSSKHFDVLIFEVALVSRLMAELSFLFIVTFSGCVTSPLDIGHLLEQMEELSTHISSRLQELYP